MKTINQLAQEFLEENFWAKESDYPQEWAQEKELLVKVIEFSQRWYDVKKCLPEKDGNYIVKLQDGHCEIISYCVEHKYFMYSSNFVTHWRPIEYPLN